MKSTKRHRLILTTLLAASVSLAQAADPLTDAIQAAYAPYREALFKTNSQSPSEAAQAMARARQAWSGIIQDYGMKAPAPYDRDPAVAGSLNDVAQVYEKAGAQIDRNDLAAAHETLEHAREIIAALRHRNQVVTFSDHMNAYHARMEVVLEHGAEMLKGAEGITALAFEAGSLDYLAARLASEAPADLAKSEDFRSLIKGVESSVADLKAALLARNPQAAQAALGKLKAPYSRLFLKFG